MRLCPELAAPVTWLTRGGKNKQPASNCSFFSLRHKIPTALLQITGTGDGRAEGSSAREDHPLPAPSRLLRRPRAPLSHLSKSGRCPLSPARFRVFLSARGSERNRKTALPAPVRCAQLAMLEEGREQPSAQERRGRQQARSAPPRSSACSRRLPAPKVKWERSVPRNLSPPACCSRTKPGSSPPDSLQRARRRSGRQARGAAVLGAASGETPQLRGRVPEP